MSGINLRAVTLQDAKMIFTWRNAKETRMNSLNTQELVYADHLAWLEQSLLMANRFLLIAELDATPIGVLRFDMQQETAEISIFLGPEYQNKGYGTAILQTGIEWIKQHQPMIQTLTAKIKDDNVASKRAFEKVGFALHFLQYQKKI